MLSKCTVNEKVNVFLQNLRPPCNGLVLKQGGGSLLLATGDRAQTCSTCQIAHCTSTGKWWSDPAGDTVDAEPSEQDPAQILSPSEDALTMMSHCQAESCWEEAVYQRPWPSWGPWVPLGPPPAAVRPHDCCYPVTGGFPWQCSGNPSGKSAVKQHSVIKHVGNATSHIDSTAMSLSKLQEMVKDREDWCAAAWVAKTWTWLSYSPMCGVLRILRCI